MAVSRRDVFRSLTSGVPTGASLAARGREAWMAEHWSDTQAASPTSPRALAIRLNSNENPLGPSAAARQAIEKAFAYAGRYPMNARPAISDFRSLIAKRNGLKPDQVALGAGSGEILDSAVHAFTSPTRGLVAGLPTFEAPARTAGRMKSPVNEILVDGAGRLDLEKMIAASSGAGLVFICNPNNPTGSLHAASAITDMVTRIRKASPDTVILIDEAYHEYVVDPAYATAIPLVAQHPNVLVSRTLSKAHGMAGLRLGYVVGQAEVVGRLARWNMPYNANALAVGAAVVSVEDEAQIARERRRNAEVLKFTSEFFRTAGMKLTDSQANFIWVDLGRPVQEFRQACEKQGVLVGRPFPPFDKTHCRISIGTMDEMQRALGVFRSVLGLTTTTTAGGR
jgi:histidinol-phosphate aminotransferase